MSHMSKLVDSKEVEQLILDIEQNMRSNEDSVKRFVEPSQGALQRAVSRQHHIVFGRRGSGKSSLLRKAAADLTVDRRPIAYVDLEAFKGHSYPNVLLSILIKTFDRFEYWLKTAAVNPSTKTSFWHRFFGQAPSCAAFNKKEAQALAETLHNYIEQLSIQLHAPDDIDVHKVVKSELEATDQTEMGLQFGTDKLGVSGKVGDSTKASGSEEVQQAYRQSKTEYLHTHILDYQKLFDRMYQLSDGASYLFLDDVYHIRRVDQAKVIDYFHRLVQRITSAFRV